MDESVLDVSMSRCSCMYYLMYRRQVLRHTSRSTSSQLADTVVACDDFCRRVSHSNAHFLDFLPLWSMLVDSVKLMMVAEEHKMNCRIRVTGAWCIYCKRCSRLLACIDEPIWRLIRLLSTINELTCARSRISSTVHPHIAFNPELTSVQFESIDWRPLFTGSTCSW